MYRRPLRAVYKSRDRQLLAFLKKQQKKGYHVYLYSDYPLEDKSRVLELKADGLYYPDNVRFSYLKPDPEGLTFILGENHLKKEDVLMIGDREEKDGQCAAAAGTDCLILRSRSAARKKQYRESQI